MVSDNEAACNMFLDLCGRPITNIDGCCLRVSAFKRHCKPNNNC